MQHKGAILEKAVRASGMSLASLTKKLNRSRRWIYDAFENPYLSIEYILEIGKIIHHDFTDDIDELKKYRSMSSESTPSFLDKKPEETVGFWKEKYMGLLEKYNNLLEKVSPH